MDLHRNLLTRAKPPAGVRGLLVAEVVLYVAAFSAHLWFALPVKGSPTQPWHVGAASLLLIVPIALNLLHGDRPAESGLRLDNLRPSIRLVLPATLAMGAGVVGLGWAMYSFGNRGWGRLAELSGVYLLWGFAQQYLLQAFALRRLRQAQVPPAMACVLAAGLFGLVHAPNWALVAATTGAGIVWCGIFLRVPNLFTLGLAHAVLAVMVYHAWFGFIHALSIGRQFVR